MSSRLPHGKGARSPGDPSPAAGARRAVERAAAPLRLASSATVHRWWAACLLTILLALAAGLLAGLAALHSGGQAAGEEAERRHHITATATSDAEYTHSDTASSTTARAVWHYPDASRHTGRVEVPPGTTPGDAVAIWVSDKGTATHPPRTAVETIAGAAVAGVGAAGAVLLAGCGAGLVRMRVVEARNLSGWEREWERVEPQWSGRGQGGDSGDH